MRLLICLSMGFVMVMRYHARTVYPGVALSSFGLNLA